MLFDQFYQKQKCSVFTFVQYNYQSLERILADLGIEMTDFWIMNK